MQVQDKLMGKCKFPNFRNIAVSPVLLKADPANQFLKQKGSEIRVKTSGRVEGLVTRTRGC